MIGTQKLLYILPDLAYTAEILKGKKDGEYSVQSFHQINGEFMADDNLLPENLKKLFEKIEPEEYTLILPDFLFADTIVSVPDTQDAAIATYLRGDLLPKIGVSTLTHETKTTVLMQRKNESRVQFTALEKEIADLLASVLSGRQIKITSIVPLSWTVKSLISLEPSISVLQIGTRLYLAEHYVGINQTSSSPLDDVEHITETITTLKGADPNLQTLYLLTNALVEEKMRAALAKTLPVQQLTLPSDDNLQMPSYIKQLIEAAGATLNSPNYPVPHFALGSATVVTSVVSQESTAEEIIEKLNEVQQSETLDINESTQKIADAEAEVAALAANVEAEAAVAAPIAREIKIETAEPVETAPEAQTSPEEIKEEIKMDSTPAPAPVEEKPVIEEKPAALPEPPPVAQLEAAPAVAALVSSTAAAVAAPVAAATSASQHKEPEHHPHHHEHQEKHEHSDHEKTATHQEDHDKKPEPHLDKNESKADNASHDHQDHKTDPVEAKIEKLAKKDVGQKKKGRSVADFLKKLLLFILIFALTIAVGLGVGYGVLKLTGNKTESEPSPTPIPAEVVVPPTPEPTPVSTVSADPVASDSAVVEEVDKAAAKVLVINATGTSGLAARIQTKLTDNDFENVTTGNAKGTYTETTDLVLMATKDTALISALEEASGLTLTYDEDYQTEDPNGTYDAVIVLNVSN